jgi:transcription-repair coupling factor (superfamily II helicase)
MQMVAKQAKNGAQFTPQGVMKWPISAAKPDEIIAEAKTLLESIETGIRG